MKTPLVRFGGNFTSGYHWRDGIGSMDKRISALKSRGACRSTTSSALTSS